MSSISDEAKAPIRERDRAPIERVIKDFESAKKQHDTFVVFVERMYRAYRGVLDKRSEAAQWTSKLHPAYGLQLVESVISNMIDDRTTFQVKPRPLLDDDARVEEYLAGAKALENILRYEMEMARFSQQQRPFAIQNSIAGLTVAKISWDYQERTARRYVTKMQDVTHPDTGEVLGSYPTLVEQEHTRITRDGPTFDVVDIRDFFWPENAQDVQDARFIIHRVWMSMDECRKLQADGLFQNVDELTVTRDVQAWEGQVWRSDELFLTNRKRGMIEILEWWGPDGQVVTVGNRHVLLSQRQNPFFHNQRPFVVASSMPQPFQFVGVSDMELIEPLQRALWTTLNQRLDNVALLNNAIIILRDTADDQDYEFAPGEFWMVEDPTEVQMWQPNALPAEVSLGSEQGIKSDLNNVTGGLGMMSGGQAQTDSATATGVQTLTSIAQSRLNARRAQFGYAYADVASQCIDLVQQFMKTDRLVPITGAGGAIAFERVSRAQIDGHYIGSAVSVSESLMRQERRAEAQALFTLALQAAPIAAASGAPINIDQFLRDLLEAFDKDDTPRYFSPAPQPQVAAGVGGAAGAPQVGDVPDPPPQGVTAPQATGIQSPSNELSQSPAVMMARALAARGGGRNT